MEFQLVKAMAIKRANKLLSKSRKRLLTIVMAGMKRNNIKLTASGQSINNNQLSNLINKDTLDYLTNVATKVNTNMKVIKHFLMIH